MVPSEYTWRPWTRTLGTGDEITVGARLKIDIVGESIPLVGEEEPVTQAIQSKVTYLLERRGFHIVDNNHDLALRLTYKTERLDRLSASSTVISRHISLTSFSTGAGAGATSGLGVSIAKAVATAWRRDTQVSSQTIDQTRSFTHTVSIDLHTANGRSAWKGDLTWDTSELDILEDITSWLQLVFSDLPRDVSVLPAVPEVKASHGLNYYKLECSDRWFACPALPFRIAFEHVPYSSHNMDLLPKAVQHPGALAAAVDLMRTAEFVLPQGKGDWEMPLNQYLWTDALLGARYRIGSLQEPVNVMIRLKGKNDGYYVTRCWSATDEEYLQYEKDMSKWKEALNDYYDVFE